MITSMKKRNHPLGCEPHKTKVSFNKARSGRLTREDEEMICVGLPLVHSPSLSASTLIVAIVGTDSRPHHSLVRGSHNPPSVGSRRLAATGSGNKSAGGGSSRSDAAATPGATVGRSLRASSRLERGAVRLGRSVGRIIGFRLRRSRRRYTVRLGSGGSGPPGGSGPGATSRGRRPGSVRRRRRPP